MTETSPQLLVPTGGDGDRALFAATVLAPWLKARLQVVAAVEDVTDYGALWAGLGVVVEPTIRIESPFGDELHDLADRKDPVLIVASDDRCGRRVARTASRPVLLVSSLTSPRLPTGPLVVDAASTTDLDVLAVGGLLASKLETPIHVVVTDSDGLAAADAARDRLRALGSEVEVDVVEPRPGASESAVVAELARSRSSLAVLTERDRLTDDLIDRVVAWGGNVLVAPPGADTLRSSADKTAAPGLTAGHDPAVASLQPLDRERCLDYLRSKSVGRLGYVDGGWPIVVPVNFRLADELVVIRSRSGGKLRAAERGDMVCLEIDGVDEAVRSGWSVVVHGPLEPVTDPATLRLAWANDPEPWVESERWHWLTLRPISISGRTVEQGDAISEPVPWWPLA